jgi:serine/threonine-protein kinase RsbT
MTRTGRRPAIRVPIREEPDVAVARIRARELACAEGFAAAATEAIATAVTEVARNIFVHAGAGDVLLEAVEERGRRGIVVVARDAAGGLASVEDAMRDGWSTSGGLGLGLPSARRLMDEFTIASVAGAGTTVTMAKWARREDPPW